jgi:hypothetical protein
MGASAHPASAKVVLEGSFSPGVGAGGEVVEDSSVSSFMDQFTGYRNRCGFSVERIFR